MRDRIRIFFFFVLSTALFSMELNFRNFDIEDGLVQSRVTSILEDSRGFVWFGTLGGGLSRFNGRDFETFDRSAGLQNELVLSIYEDQDHDLWIGTYSGVYKFDGKKFYYMDPAAGFPEGRVRSITGWNNGEIYFSDTGKGIVLYRNGEIIDRPEFRNFSGRNAVSLFADRERTLWIGTNEGLFRYSEGKTEKIPGPDDTGIFKVSAVFRDNSDNLWVGSAGGLYIYNKKEWRLVWAGKVSDPSFITDIHESSDGLIRVGTEMGLLVFNGDRTETITRKEGLISDHVTALIEDREKNIWIGTDGGISKQISWFPFKRYTLKSGLKNENIRSFMEDEDGGVLIFSDEGIDMILPGSGMVHSGPPVYPPGPFYPAFRDLTGNRWFCNEGSILLIKNGEISIEYNLPDKKFSYYTDIFQDSSKRVWFAAFPAGIIMYDGVTFTPFPDVSFPGANRIQTICGDDEGRIWFGSDRGIFYFKDGAFRRHPGFSQLENVSITKILKDPNGNFWIGTYSDGLFLADPRIISPVIEKYEYPSALPEKNIVSMAFDDDGDLWAGTNVGFFKLELEKYRYEGSGKYRYFSGNAGMKGLKCNENAIFKTRSGNIWFGTRTGAIVFDPGEIKESFPYPVTHITDVRLFKGKKDISEYCSGFLPGTNLPETLVLPHDENHISFSFMGITSAIPEKVKFRWKLEPLDSGWSASSTQKQISYSNLSAGKYQFHVKCSTDPQMWDVPPATFRFTITSSFWKSEVFYYSVFIIIAGILLLIYFFTASMMKNRENKLQESIKERTDELIIEKKKVEMINRELENRVAERTAELEQKNIQLIQAKKLEVIGSLAGGVAHDLNNILTGLVSYPDLLLRSIPEDSPHRKHIEIIKNSGTKAAEMVQDLLTLTRKGVISKEPISINEIIGDFFNGPVFQKLTKNNPNISFKTALTEEKTYIFGSSIHITKTIMNLIINASEALPIDGTVEISTERCVLDKPLKGYDRVNEGDYIKLTIKDNGIGIDENDIENIYEPFFSKKRMGKSGTGLGMTVVLWTIKDHYGYINVNSVKGQGTEFQLFFPAAIYDYEKNEEQDETELKRDQIGKGEHILIVEDDENNRKLAEEILSEFNYKVSSVSSGEEAIDFVMKNDVDLLILDMIMDGIDGLETFIRILMRKGEQKAIITSGFSENENVKEAQKLGAGAYLKKPYLKMQLIKAVESELRR